MKKLVPENLNEAIKHLTPRDNEEIQEARRNVRQAIKEALNQADSFDLELNEENPYDKAVMEGIDMIKPKDLRYTSDELGRERSRIFFLLKMVTDDVKETTLLAPSKTHDFGVYLFPTEKLIYFYGGMGVSTWFFDYKYTVKKIDEYVDKLESLDAIDEFIDI